MPIISNLPAWRGFVDEIVGRGNARNSKRIDQERMALKKLPVRKTADYEEVNVDVTTSSAFTLRKVFYSVPSPIGTNRTSGDVRSPVAIGGKPDMARTAQFGRDGPEPASHCCALGAKPAMPGCLFATVTRIAT